MRTTREAPWLCARHRVRAAQAPYRRAAATGSLAGPAAAATAAAMKSYDESADDNDEEPFSAARRHLKLYAYGQSWMLRQHPWLRAMALKARPTFLDAADFQAAADKEKAAPGAANPPAAVASDFGGGGGSGRGDHVDRSGDDDGEDDGCVCWISSAGCLTPLHYDLNDGLLLQMVGHKTVWLFEWAERGKLALRCTSREPGINNYERQRSVALANRHARPWHWPIAMPTALHAAPALELIAPLNSLLRCSQRGGAARRLWAGSLPAGSSGHTSRGPSRSGRLPLPTLRVASRGALRPPTSL